MGTNIDAAQARFPLFSFAQCNAEELPFDNASFDIVVACLVFSAVLEDTTARNMAREISRVLRPGGVVTWYDIRYPNPSNRNVRAMTEGRICKLFPEFKIVLEAITVLPPLAYKLGAKLATVNSTLSLFSLLLSHYVGVLKKA